MEEERPADRGTIEDEDTVGARPSFRQRVRVVLLATFLFVTAAWFVLIGVVFERTVVMLWLFVLLLIVMIGDERGGRSVRRLVIDWGGFLALLLLYRYTGAVADNLGRPIGLDPLVSFDRLIGFGETPTERLQGWFPQTEPVPFWQVPLSFVYFSHFFATPVTAAVLWRRNRIAWLRFIRSYFTMAVIGVVTYALYPAAPPWMAADVGVIDPVERSANFGLYRLGLRFTASVVETGQQWSNPVAAMPSMHAAFAAFLALFFWQQASRRGRFGLGVYALSMAFVLLLTAEHWMIDILAGWLVAGASVWFWNGRRLRTRSRQHAVSEPAAPEATARDQLATSGTG